MILGGCPVSSIIPGVELPTLPPLSQYHHHYNVTPALIGKISSNEENGFSMEPITWVEHEIKVVDFCSALGEDKEAGSELSGGQSEAGVLVMAWRRLWLWNNCWGIVVLESD